MVEAISQTPFYQKKDSVVELYKIDHFSIISKKDVINYPQDFHSRVLDNNQLVTVTTSGSSGYPLSVKWDCLDYCNSLMEVWRLRQKIGVLPKDNYITAHVSFNVGKNIYTNKVIIQKNNLSLSKVYYDEATLLYYYYQIVDFQPTWMMLPPSFLYGFVVFLDKRGLCLPESIKLVELTGEYCTNETFAYLQNLYPSICWRLLYGMQEFNAIGYGTPNGLEILRRNVVVEIFSESGILAQPLEEGCVIVTGLKNTAMPLIRYKTGDYGYIDCNGLLHITRARSNDMIITDKGEVYDGSLFWMIIHKLKADFNLNILQFQVIFEHDGLHFYLNLDKSDSINVEIISKYINNILANKYNLCQEIFIHDTQKINTNVNGNKIKYFINNQSNVCR
jgi:phenylacetate-CoA ligase